ncbi:MAG: hypothetical protein ACREO5_00485 [Candidatus Binatia bacterium]
MPGADQHPAGDSRGILDEYRQRQRRSGIVVDSTYNRSIAD